MDAEVRLEVQLLLEGKDQVRNVVVAMHILAEEAKQSSQVYEAHRILFPQLADKLRYVVDCLRVRPAQHVEHFFVELYRPSVRDAVSSTSEGPQAFFTHATTYVTTHATAHPLSLSLPPLAPLSPYPFPFPLSFLKSRLANVPS